MPFRLTLLTCLAVLFAIAGDLAAQNALPKESPFGRPSNAPTAAVAPDEQFEFAGVSLMGSRTDLILYDKAAKKSRWITLGETVEGVSALNYNSQREEAIVRIRGTEKTLPLRKPSPVRSAAPAMPANAAPGITTLPANAAPAITLTSAAPAPVPVNPQAKAETEARMLVSDLLEIGMAQRRAYEEAQRKAAGAGKAGVNQPGSVTPPRALAPGPMSEPAQN